MNYEDLKGKEYKVILRIDWLDAVNDDPDWKHIEDLEDLETVKCTTWGCLTKVTDNEIVVHGSVNSNDQIANRFTIPRVCITKIKKIDNV